MWIIQSLCRMPPRLCLSWWLSFVPSLWCIRSLSRSCQIPSQCRLCALHNPSQRRRRALCSPSFQNLSPRDLCCLTPSLNSLRFSQDDSFVSSFQLIHLTVSFVEFHLKVSDSTADHLFGLQKVSLTTTGLQMVPASVVSILPWGGHPHS